MANVVEAMLSEVLGVIAGPLLNAPYGHPDYPAGWWSVSIDGDGEVLVSHDINRIERDDIIWQRRIGLTDEPVHDYPYGIALDAEGGLAICECDGGSMYCVSGVNLPVYGSLRCLLDVIEAEECDTIIMRVSHDYDDYVGEPVDEELTSVIAASIRARFDLRRSTV